MSTTGPAPDEFTLGDPGPRRPRDRVHHLQRGESALETRRTCSTMRPSRPAISAEHHDDSCTGQGVRSHVKISPFTLGFPPHDGSTVVPAKGVLRSIDGDDTGLQDAPTTSR